MTLQRREFLKLIPAAAINAAVLHKFSWAMGRKMKFELNDSGFPTRILGNTSERVSMIGFGGIVVMNEEPKHAADVVSWAVEKGINYFDVAPSYGDAEIKLGPALKPYRENCFLACKTMRRDRKGAKEELEQSLKNLQTDRLDLYQLHALTDVEKDVEAALGKGGAIETFLEARKQGIVKYLGFSAHSPAAALKAMREFDFDTVMYPVNFNLNFDSGFQKEVLEEAKKRKMGIIALKSMAKQIWPDEKKRESYLKCWYQPIDDPDIALKALSWTIAQNVNVALPPAEEKLFRMAVELVRKVSIPTQKDLVELEKRSKDNVPIFDINGVNG